MGSRSADAIKFRFRKRRQISAVGPAIIGLRGGLEALDKAVRVEWLGQIAKGPTRKRPGAGLLIGKCCEKHKGNTAPLTAQVMLQLDAAHSWHLDIRHYAREIVEAIRSQKVFGGRECVYDITERPYQAAGRGTHGFVIVNDCDKK